MSESLVEICRLKKGDSLSDLISLSKDFFYEYESHHEEFFRIDNLSDNDIIDYLNRFIDVEDRRAFVAVLEGKIVGYITIYINSQPSFWKMKKVGNISGLMVHKDYRRKGIASQLLTKAIDFFKEKEVKYYTVFTSVNNNPGIEFYKKNGMEPLYTTMVGKVLFVDA